VLSLFRVFVTAFLVRPCAGLQCTTSGLQWDRFVRRMAERGLSRAETATMIKLKVNAQDHTAEL
jgi:hypothetical protein